MASRKGQAAVELVLILAAAFLILTIIVILANQQLGYSRESLRHATAQASLNDIARAAEEVAREGPGSARKVPITVPDGVLGNDSFVAGHLLNWRLQTANGVTDVNAYSSAQMQGSLPTAGASVWVIAREGYVFVGQSALFLKPTVLFATLPASSSSSKGLEVINEGNSSLTVNLATNWTNPQVIVSVPPSVVVPPFSSVNVSVSLTSTTSTGTFGGSVLATAPAIAESAFADLIVEVR